MHGCNTRCDEAADSISHLILLCRAVTPTHIAHCPQHILPVTPLVVLSKAMGFVRHGVCVYVYVRCMCVFSAHGRYDEQGRHVRIMACGYRQAFDWISVVVVTGVDATQSTTSCILHDNKRLIPPVRLLVACNFFELCLD